jgi:hypothetical protein
MPQERRARTEVADVLRLHRVAGAPYLFILLVLAMLCWCLFGTGPSSGVGSSRTTTGHGVLRDIRNPSRVAVFGDSLAWEAEPYFVSLVRARFATAGITYDSLGGTAICDWLPTMRRVENTEHPQVVELEFSGNALTPCMKGLARPEPAYYERYRADAEAAIKIFVSGGAHVYLIGAPITRVVESARANWDLLNRQYARIAATDTRSVTYVDAGNAVEGPDHTYVEVLPCLPIEPCTGSVVDAIRLNTVRAPDGVHFCPIARGNKRGVIRTCPVYSSGAYRYARAMVQGLLNARYL